MTTSELTRDFMLERIRARDASFDGLFLTGVLSTGIYCLASCPARPPKPENIRFFSHEEEAKEAGLRACLRCRPDDFLRGHDPQLELIREIGVSLLQRPEDFPHQASIRDRFSVGATRLAALFRRHYHDTPSAFLGRSRTDRAAEVLLSSSESVLDVGFRVGFESPSAFHESFKRRFFQSPNEYRKLRQKADFVLEIPPEWNLENSLSFHGRDLRGVNSQRRESTLVRVLRLKEAPVVVVLETAPGSVKCFVESENSLSTEASAEVHLQVRTLLGLLGDPTPFEKKMFKSETGRRLVEGNHGLLSPQTPTVYEAVVWSILGQQVNVKFASTLRQNLITLCGPRVSELAAHPSPSEVANLDLEDLLSRQYSRRKAEYLLDLSRAVATGELPLERFREQPATWIENQLLAQRGLGPWSVNYVLLRGLNFSDCVPSGDVGLMRSLKEFFDLPNRPSKEETLSLMEPFRPYRTLATLHLWNRL